MYLLCSTQDLPEGRVCRFEADGLALIGVRRQGQVYLYADRCPHRGIDLGPEQASLLDDSGSLLQCAHHAALFLIETGECIAGPCEGRALTALPCHEDVRGVWLTD